MESGTIEQALPGLEAATGREPQRRRRATRIALDAAEAADGRSPAARTPSSRERIAEQLGVELGEVELKTFANGETYCRYERVDPRRRRLHRPDRLRARSTST